MIGSSSSSSSMRKSYKDSIKSLEADIQHANTLASEFRRNGACLQMRMSYSPAAHLFLFLVQWTDCRLASALGLLRIMIYKVYADGTTTMSTYERKASVREFYGIRWLELFLNYYSGIPVPQGSCLSRVLGGSRCTQPYLHINIYGEAVSCARIHIHQDASNKPYRRLQRGITDMEDKKQKAVFLERYRKKDDNGRKQFMDIDAEREDECGICMEMNSKVVLPNCSHAMCLKCYNDWYSRSQSCPFCRDSLKGVKPCDLWVYTDSRDIVDMATVAKENVMRLFTYIDKLPLFVPDSGLDMYGSHVR